MATDGLMALDLEYDIEESFTTGLRAIFRHDTNFAYLEDTKATRLIISTAFPKKDEELKIPQIVITGTNYQLSQLSLFDNFHSDIIVEGVIVGSKHALNVPYSTSLVCLAPTDSSAKDLANNVVNYVWMLTEIFNNALCLNIQSVGKSPGGPQRQIPDKAFAHTVSVSGNLNLTINKVLNSDSMRILKDIKMEIQKQ